MSEGDETQIDINVKNITNLIEKAYWWFSARKILIIGQERSGKTRLFDYLMTEGQLIREGDESRVTVMEDVKKFRSVTVKSGGGSRELQIRRIGDQSGQSGPFIHAQLVKRFKPHLVFVVLDVTSPIEGERVSSGGTWFRHFAPMLGDFLRDSGRTRKELHCMCILLNKQDKLAGAKRDKVVEKYKKLIDAEVIRHIKKGVKPQVFVETTSIVELEDSSAVRKNLNRIIFQAAKHAEG